MAFYSGTRLDKISPLHSSAPRILVRGLIALFLTMLALPAPAEQPYRSPGTLQPHAVRRVPEPLPPPEITVSVEPAEVERGQTARLRWVVRFARRVLLNGEEIAPFGDIPVSPANTTEYVISAVGAGERAEKRAGLRVLSPPDPPAVRFYAVPDRIRPGDTVLLIWSVRDAMVVTIDDRRVDAEGQMQVRPDGPRRYEIEARGERASARASATVMMLPDPPAPPVPIPPPPTLPVVVHFDFEQAVVLESDIEALARVARALKEDEALSLRVIGHTDARGEERFNLQLGAARAEAVRMWLSSQHGVSPTRILTESRGEVEPVAPNVLTRGGDNPEGRARNRRAEIVVMGPALSH